MFNPFNSFQSFGQAASDAAKSADTAGGVNSSANPFASMTANMTSGPFGPAFGATKEKIEAGMQDAVQQWQTMFNPQKSLEKLFDMTAVKSMFPPQLTQAMTSWSEAFKPANSGGAAGMANPLEQMQQAGQHFASQAQQTMQALQGAAQQAAQQGSVPTGAVSGNLGSVDLSALIAAQQKNMEVLASAQSATVSGWQQVLKRQSEIFHDTMQTAATAMNELMATGAPEEKLARQADIAKQAFEQAGKNIEELAQLVTKGNQEALRVIGARVQESCDEIKAMAQNNPLTKAAADAAEQTMQTASSAMQGAAKTTSNTAAGVFKTTQDAARDAAASTDAVQ